MLPELSRDEILRYSRHLLIPEVGLEGQRKLKNSSILIVGTGGLGSPVALYRINREWRRAESNAVMEVKERRRAESAQPEVAA